MNQESLQTLKEGYGKLPPKDQAFALDLLKGWEKYGSLSTKQWDWVERLADQVECVGVPDFTKEFTQVGEMSGVIELFNKAKQHLKWPKIVLQTKGGQKVSLSLPGPASKFYGSVAITDGGQYGQNKFFGAISKDGQWDVAKAALPIKEDLTNVLSMLAKRPAATAAAYGAMTGNCCFCNSKLTDAKSTAVGYGPTCAKQWGLPWGPQGHKSPSPAQKLTPPSAFLKSAWTKG